MWVLSDLQQRGLLISQPEVSHKSYRLHKADTSGTPPFPSPPNIFSYYRAGKIKPYFPHNNYDLKKHILRELTLYCKVL